MKKLSILIATAFVAINVNAQISLNDIAQYGSENIQGTARFEAMSGAFGALGGDLSAVSINPASSAVFNNSFITTSLSNNNINNSSFYLNGNENTEETNSFNINQLGAVLILKNSGENVGWKKVALSVNYSIANNFDNEFFVAANNSNQSIDQYFLNYAQGELLSDLSIQENEYIEDAYLNIGADLGYGTQQGFLGLASGIISPDDDTDGNNTSYSSNGDFTSLYQDYSVYTRGLNNKFVANIAAQYGEHIYVGASVNLNIIDKVTETLFYEDGYNVGSPLEFVSFENYLKTYGNGVSLSVGGIAKVNHMIRLGASYQSPTWYNLTDELSQIINTNLADPDIDFIDESLVNILPDYKIKTPGKLTASAAIIFGKMGLISIDYGYQNMANSSIKKSSLDYSIDNQSIENNLKAVSTFKVGGEFKVNQWSFRGGYRFEESPYKNGNMIGDLSGFSLGAGYNFGITVIDLAISESQRDIDHQLFNNGLTNTASIDKINTNVTLSMSINL